MRSASSAVMTATIRRSGRSGAVHMGAELRFLLIALLFLVVIDVDVRCITTANAEDIVTFDPLEVAAFHAIRENWTSGGLNQQLSSILNWTIQQDPCDISAETSFEDDPFYAGAWLGVGCTARLQYSNQTRHYYNVSVTGLGLFGSNASCDNSFDFSIGQCDFQGIQGVLPSEIGNLTNLEYLYLSYHPNLTGEVPVEIWQLPRLTTIELSNNNLHGPLPSSSWSLSSSLESIDLSNNSLTGKLEVSSNGTLFSSSLASLDLSNNHFNGMLEVSSNGTLFSSSLTFLNLGSNQLYGQVDLQGWDARAFDTLDLSYNNFNGTFSSGPYFNPFNLYLSNNQFTSIKFPNFSEIDEPALHEMKLDGNQLHGSFPYEFLTNFTSFSYLDVSRNNYSGSLDFRHIPNELEIYRMNVSNNHFHGIFHAGKITGLVELDLSNNHFDDILFDMFNGTFEPKLERLSVSNFLVFVISVIQAMLSQKLPLLNAT